MQFTEYLNIWKHERLWEIFDDTDYYLLLCFFFLLVENVQKNEIHWKL